MSKYFYFFICHGVALYQNMSHNAPYFACCNYIAYDFEPFYTLTTQDFLPVFCIL